MHGQRWSASAQCILRSTTEILLLARFGSPWLIGLMWTRCKACDACQIAPATVETGAGFFLCDDCEAVVVIAFLEFELPESLPIDG